MAYLVIYNRLSIDFDYFIKNGPKSDDFTIFGSIWLQDLNHGTGLYMKKFNEKYFIK